MGWQPPDYGPAAEMLVLVACGMFIGNLFLAFAAGIAIIFGCQDMWCTR